MIDALIVHRVLKIPDTQGFSFYLFFCLFSSYFPFPAVSGGKQREAGGLAALQKQVDQQTCIT